MRAEKELGNNHFSVFALLDTHIRHRAALARYLLYP